MAWLPIGWSVANHYFGFIVFYSGSRFRLYRFFEVPCLQGRFIQSIITFGSTQFGVVFCIYLDKQVKSSSGRSGKHHYTCSNLGYNQVYLSRYAILHYCRRGFR